METQQVKATRSSWMVVAIAVVMGVILGAIAVVVFWPEDSGAAAVTLQRADVAGDDPFTDSVQTGEVPVIEQPAVVAASAVRADLPQDATTSVLVATGTAPGLYGGSGDAHVCDAAKLVDYLNQHPDKAEAFSEVLGITPDGIADYVAKLTPVVLLSDTLVTNHGFKNGHATALTSVLQAGTSVMVDQQGVPRVKCNCGNPLTPPQVVPTGSWKVHGDGWDGFDTGSVTGVVAGDTVTEFRLCHLRTGEIFTVPVGSTLTAGTPPPNIDGDWTIELREKLNLMTPLPPGQLDPRICPTANLEGAVLVIRGTRASIDGGPGLGKLVGTVEGAPKDSPAWLGTIQQSLNGAVIKLHPDGETAPEYTLAVATTSSLLSGGVSMTGAQDPSTRVSGCDAGVVATHDGSAPKSTSTTSTSTTSTTVASAPVEPIAGSGGPCDEASLLAFVQSSISQPVQAFEVVHCNGTWAFVAYTWDDQEDPALLEWNGSAWQGGACQTYVDPTDWTKSPVVPQEYWIPCISD